MSSVQSWVVRCWFCVIRWLLMCNEITGILWRRLLWGLQWGIIRCTVIDKQKDTFHKGSGKKAREEGSADRPLRQFGVKESSICFASPYPRVPSSTSRSRNSPGPRASVRYCWIVALLRWWCQLGFRMRPHSWHTFFPEENVLHHFPAYTFSSL